MKADRDKYIADIKADREYFMEEQTLRDSKIAELNLKLVQSKKVEEIFEFVEQRVGTIALAVKMGRRKEESEERLSTSEIVKAYLDSDREISLKELGEKLGLTGNAVKARLKNVGIYEGKNANYKGNNGTQE